MRRREFITLIGGAAAWPLAARAQQPGKVPTIGFLSSGTRATWALWVAAFVQRLRELGWTEGRTVAIEYRWAEGRSERFAEIAAEFNRLKVDVIVTVGSAVLAAKQATSDIPIVFAVAADPVGGGLVASLAQPGGNVTGLSLQQTDVDKIVDAGGALVTEYLPRESYSGENFVRRNRLQAALGRVLIPVEWNSRSGTAHTVRFATALKRPIACLRMPDWPQDRVVLTKGCGEETGRIFTVPGEESELRAYTAHGLTLTVTEPSQKPQLPLFADR